MVWDEHRQIGHSLKADSIRRECEASLRRLKVDAIDLYQIHWPDPDEDIEEGWATMAKLKEEGKVRNIGVSNFNVAQMERALAIAPITSLQPRYSLIHRDVEDEVLPFAAHENIGVIVYSPMASGLLTGAMTPQRITSLPSDDWRKGHSDFREPQLSHNLELVRLLRSVGDRHGRSPGEAAVAWVLCNPAVTGAIVGARRPTRCGVWWGRPISASAVGSSLKSRSSSRTRLRDPRTVNASGRFLVNRDSHSIKKNFEMKETVGFIGLGGMGLAMATNLLKAGFGLRVYNRTAEKARPLLEHGAVIAGSPAEVSEPGGIVVTMVTDDRAVEAVTLGADGLLDRLGDGVHLSMSTIAPRTARRLAAIHRERGAGYVASPVFGKPEVAAAARLWIAASGDAAARARVRPLQEAMSQRVFDFGDEPGAANVIKLAGNFLLGAAIEAMAEAFTLAEKQGVPRRQTYEFFTQTLFDCFVYRGYGDLVASERYQPVGAQPSLIRKDLGLILNAADEELVPMPLASLIHQRRQQRLPRAARIGQALPMKYRKVRGCNWRQSLPAGHRVTTGQCSPGSTLPLTAM